MITVVGSYAVGMTMFTDRIPLCGETLIASGYVAEHGGKGSNQAVVIARLGGEPYFVACVGKDNFGNDALELFKKEKVNAGGVRVCEDSPTGVGFIIVDKEGSNIITLDPGAIKSLQPSDIEAAREMIKNSSSLVMQLEITPELVFYAAKYAHDLGVPVILNPAPYQELPQEIWQYISILTPNETEARLIVGREPDDPVSHEKLAEEILNLGVEKVIITMGEKGAYFASKDGQNLLVPGYTIKAVDTTGAGDTFTGALAVALSEGKELPEAIKFGNAAAAITCQGKGVIPALPYREQVEKMKDKK